MVKRYTLFRIILPLALFVFPCLLRANGDPNGGPPTSGTGSPDSIASLLGHCNPVIYVNPDCTTKTIELRAFIDYAFSGQRVPVNDAVWTTGEIGPKIYVVPPGTWSWDASTSGCEPNHWNNEYSACGPFFDGPLVVFGPPAICKDESYELDIENPDGSCLMNIEWTPGGSSSLPLTVDAPGTYVLSLTDEFGCPFTDQIVIPPSPPVAPALLAPQAICPENDTAFVSVAQNFAEYLWDNGATTNPLLITEPGTYAVTVTNQYGCTGTKEIIVPSGGVQGVSVELSAPAICPGQNDILTGPPGFVSYVWSDGDLGIANIVSQTGTYTVTVTNQYGCTGTGEATVGALPTPPIAITSTPLCPGDTATLTATGGFPNYSWSSGQTTNAINTGTPGTYTVVVTGTSICTSTASVTLVQLPAPNTLIAPPAQLNCNFPNIILDAGASSTGPNFSFGWTTVGGHFVSGQSSLTPTVDSAGTYTLLITNTTTGCTSSATVTVTSNMQAPPAPAGNPATLTCVVTNLNIGPATPPSNPGLVPSWVASGGGNIVSGQNSWNPNVNMPGTYILTVKDTLNGCTSTASVVIGQNTALPNSLIAAPSLLTCTMSTVPLDGTGSSSGPNFSYLWTTANGTISGNPTSALSQASAVGTYVLQVTNAVNGCTATSSVTVAADLNIPIATAPQPDTLTCVVLTVPIDASNSSSGPSFVYTWTGPTPTSIVSGQGTLQPTVNAPGTYTLQLVNNANSCSTTLSVLVPQDIAPPTASAGPSPTLSCVVPSLNLDGSGSSAGPNFTYQWSTLDGIIVSGATGLSPTVSKAGTYTLLVTNQTNGCTSTATVQVLNDASAPVALIANPATLTCTTLQTVIDALLSSQGPTYVYNWTGPVGGIVGGQGTLQLTIGLPGVYQLDIVNTVNGCTDTRSVTVTQDIATPVALAGNDGLINCTTPTGSLGSAGNPTGPNFTLEWTTIGGSFTSPVDGPTVTIDGAGTYQLLITNTSNGCTDTDDAVVLADFALPAASAGPGFQLNCVQPTTVLQGTGSAGPNFTYLWTTTDGFIVNGSTTLNPTINKAGTYQLLVTNTTNGCTTTASVAVTNDVNAPVAAIANPATLTCTTLQTVIDGLGSTQDPLFTYSWSGPAGGIVSGQSTLQPTVDLPGVYQLDILNTANGCTDVATVTVPQDILAPVALAGNDGLINCTTPAGTVGSASNPTGPNFTLQWTTIGGSFTSPTNGPTATIDAAGTYQLLITNTQNGCTDTDDAVVVADFALPTVDAGATFQLNCALTTTVLQGTGSTGAIFSYQWTTTDGSILNGATTPTPTVDAPGTYKLVITNTQNGCSSTDQVLITENVAIPNSAIAAPGILTCTTTSLNLNGNGTSVSPTISYVWAATNGGNISGGGTSLAPTVDNPGTYTLLTTDAANSCTSTAVINVTENVVNPVVDAGNPNTLTCVVLTLPVSATIVSSSSPGISYVWSTLDGTIVGPVNIASPTIGAPGLYTVVVTDAVNGCTGTDNVQIGADVVLPVANIASPATLTCTLVQTPIDATASSPGAGFTYSWTTPNGHIVSGGTTNQPLVDDPGVYNLLITNTTNGCTQTATTTVPEDVLYPNAVAGPTVGLDCDTQVNGLDGSASDQGANFTYLWSTSNGQIVSGGTGLTPQIGDPGIYVLTVSNTQNGCVSTSSVTVTEDVTPPGFVIAPPQLLTCVTTVTPLTGTAGTGFGNAPTYTWAASGGGNIVSGGNSLNATADAPGNYTLTVVNTENGCTHVEQVAVSENVAPPPLNTQLVGPLTCSVLERTLQATAPAQALLQWTTQNGHIVSGANTANPVVDEPGQYTVTATLPLNGCTAIAATPVVRETNIPTGLQFLLDPPLCNGVLGLLTVEQIDGGVGPFDYSIDGGASFFPAQDIDGLEPGSYSLVIRDANGCKVTQTVPVPAPPTPAVALPPSFSIVLGDNQDLLADVPSSFPLNLVQQVIWEPMTGLTFEGTSIAQLLNPVAKPFVTTEYKVTIITEEGCRAESRTIIRVDRDIDIYAPNIIWPEDPDGQNGAFTLYTRQGSVNRILSLQVYDRWGEQLFVNKDFLPDNSSLGWPGDFKGELVNPGVFVWWAEVELVDGQKVLLKGDVTVVR